MTGNRGKNRRRSKTPSRLTKTRLRCGQIGSEKRPDDNTGQAIAPSLAAQNSIEDLLCDLGDDDLASLEHPE